MMTIREAGACLLFGLVAGCAAGLTEALIRHFL